MEFKIGSGRTALSYDVTFHGRDLRVHIDGGVSHIGSLTAASKDFWETVIFPGHKDYFLTEPLAKQLLSVFPLHIVVTAGVHLDHIADEEIRIFLQQNEMMIQEIISFLKEEGICGENRPSK